MVIVVLNEDDRPDVSIQLTKDAKKSIIPQHESRHNCKGIPATFALRLKRQKVLASLASSLGITY